MPYAGPIQLPASLEPQTLDSDAIETLYAAMGTAIAVAVSLCAALGHDPYKTMQIMAAMTGDVIQQILSDQEHGAWAGQDLKADA